MKGYFKTGGAFLLFWGLSLPFFTYAQTKTITHRETAWLALFTSTRISEKYSLWNDFHLVPKTFGVARTGLTRHLDRTNLTVGFAHLWLTPGSGNTRLSRHEYRPWGQVQFTLPVTGSYILTQRIRYDARFRQKVFAGETIDGYNFHHRLRFQVNLKRNFPAIWGEQVIPFVAIADELLLNFGKEITHNTFDQNRISVAIGLQKQTRQIQLGYMNRFAQTGPPGNYLQDHLLLAWFTQNLDLRKLRVVEPLGEK